MATETPDPKQPGEPTVPVPRAPERTTPVPSSPAAPIETLYAAEPASASQQPESVAEAPHSAWAAGTTSAGMPSASTSRAAWSYQRWSGRRTAAVAALAFVLGGAGAVAIAAALPDGGVSASDGDRSTGVGGQLPGGQFPGAPHDHADRDGDDDDGPGGRDFRGVQPPQGGLPDGQQQDANGGTDSDI